MLELSLKLALGDRILGIDETLESRVTGIFGPSGSGKTSLLQAVAGLRKPASGRIAFRATPWFDSAVRLHLPTTRRRTGLVPQDHQLFPHWNVRRNLAAGQRRALEQGIAWDDLFRRVCETLEIGDLLDRYPHNLSGGERQRVALGRALCSGPQLLLLDEPMASLDERLRHRILPFLMRLRESFDIPILIVSHNRLELQAICDEVIRIDHGTVIARGTPAGVFGSDASPNGEPETNLFTARVIVPGEDTTRVRIGDRGEGPEIAIPGGQFAHGNRLLLCIDANEILVATGLIAGLSARNCLRAELKSVTPGATGQRLCFALSELPGVEWHAGLTADAVAELDLHPGRAVGLVFKSSAVRLFGEV